MDIWKEESEKRIKKGKKKKQKPTIYKDIES
jgi:hypothetical protein